MTTSRRHQPERDPGAVVLGVRAALLIFAPAIALHVLLQNAGMSFKNGYGWGFLVEGALQVAMVVFASLAVARRLPPPSRDAFWLTVGICLFGSFIFWCVTCSVSALYALR